MGLPLFVAPIEPQVASKAAEKQTAAPRSVIRRHRTLRGPHGRPNAAETRRRRIIDLVADSPPEEYEVWEVQRRSPPNDAELSYPQDRARRIYDAGPTRLRDTLIYEREQPEAIRIRSPNTEINGPLMPPVPESRDYSAAGDQQQRLRNISRRLAARRNLAPTPPYTEADHPSPPRVGSNSPQISVGPRPRSPPRTASIDAGLSSPTPREEDSEVVMTARRPNRTDTSISALSERVHALNRRSTNLRRRVRASAFLDGLGDRDRSLSPEGGAAWDTLLTSITPDPQPPSAGSSFASAPSAIAAASSTESGPSSASTSMTSVGLSQETPVLHDCDMSDSGSTGDEDEDMYALQEFGRIGSRRWRSYADVVTARAERALAAEEPDLDSMHMIISRLVNSDEIPDEFWVSAGLSRNLRREGGREPAVL